MPRGDRRGPEGFGSRSGKGLGYCSGYDSPGFTKTISNGAGRGCRRGISLDFRWRHQFNSPFHQQISGNSKEQELNSLKNQAEQVKLTMDSINKRIEELENN